MGVFPVVDNLLHVAKSVEQEVIAPLGPVHSHGAVPVHTGTESPTSNSSTDTQTNLKHHR